MYRLYFFQFLACLLFSLYSAQDQRIPSSWSDLGSNHEGTQYDQSPKDGNPPENLLSINTGIKKLVRFDIVVLIPHAQGLDIEQWTSHTCSVRILLGRLSAYSPQTSASYDYIVLEKQQPSLKSSQVVRSRPFSLQRTRQVWSLGSKGLDALDPLSISRVQQYSINENTGECMHSSEEDIRKMGIELQPENLSNSVKTLTHVNLAPQFLRYIMGSNHLYHLIQDDTNESDQTHWRTRVYEMRLSTDRLIELGLSDFWPHSISVIRRHVDHKPNLDGVTAPEFTEISFTLHLLNEQATRQEAQVYLRLIELENLDEARLHRAIDVSSCYYSMTNKQDKPIKFTIEYKYNQPILDVKALNDQNELASLGWLHGRLARSIFHHRFLVSLSDAPVPLDPQQITNVQVETGAIDSDKLHISAYVHDRPLELDFRAKTMTRIDENVHRGVSSHLAGSSIECAHSCIHFNCRAYDYSNLDSTCNILLNIGSTEDGTETISTINYRGYTFYERLWQHPFASAHQFVQEIKHTLASPSDKRWLKILTQGFMVARADGTSKIVFVNLEPISIRIENDHYSYLSGDHRLQADSSEAGEEVHESQSELAQARTPYSLVFSHSNLELPSEPDELTFPFPEGRGLSLEECEHYCAQVDCGSFSYCTLDKHCLVSRLHRTDDLKKHIKRDQALCSVFARNYWTKFIQVRVSSKGLSVERDGDDDHIHQLSVSHERDCANACVESTTFICRSFYFCSASKTDQPSDCYLSSSRLAIGAIRGPPIGARELDEKNRCKAYRRSFLSEFMRYYRKTLVFDDTQSEDHEIILMSNDPSADRCAHECLDGTNRCAGFTVCQPEVGGKIATCTVSRSQRRPSLVELKPSERCTTFVPTADLTLAGPDLVWSSQEQNASYGTPLELRSNASSSPTTGLALLLAGALVGYVANALVQSRRQQA